MIEIHEGAPRPACLLCRHPRVLSCHPFLLYACTKPLFPPVAAFPAVNKMYTDCRTEHGWLTHSQKRLEHYDHQLRALDGIIEVSCAWEAAKDGLAHVCTDDDNLNVIDQIQMYSSAKKITQVLTMAEREDAIVDPADAEAPVAQAATLQVGHDEFIRYARHLIGTGSLKFDGTNTALPTEEVLDRAWASIVDGDTLDTKLDPPVMLALMHGLVRSHKLKKKALVKNEAGLRSKVKSLQVAYAETTAREDMVYKLAPQLSSALGRHVVSSALYQP